MLSPSLFNLYTYLEITIGRRTINNLPYADDTVLLAEIEQDLQEILNEVKKL